MSAINYTMVKLCIALTTNSGVGQREENNMNKLLEGLTNYGSRFLIEVMGMLAGPKRFLQRLDFDASQTLTQGLIFYVLCLGVYFVLELPFVTTAKEIWIEFVTLVVLFVIGTLLISVTYKVSFRAVGGSGVFRDHLLVTMYISGPVYIFSSFLAAASKGIVLTNDPDLYPLFTQLMNDSLSMSYDPLEMDRLRPIFDSGPGLAAYLLTQLVFIGGTVWIIVCWGAYRHINNVTKLRSIFAFVVFLILSVPIGYILVMVQLGLGVNLF